MSMLDEIIKSRKEKIKRLKELGNPSYPNNLRPTKTIEEVKKNYSNLTKEELEEKNINLSIVGRIITIRSFGKAAFFHILGQTKKIQCYIKKDVVEGNSFDIFKLADAGDIVFVDGQLFRTKTDELTLMVKRFSVVTKSIRPLPEKWHGLKDIELRYRKRYLDLIVNEESKKTFLIRAKVVDFLRNFLKSRGYIEVETPMLHPIAGGAMARPFITHHNALDIDLFLRIAPELYLKRLLVGGFYKVFELNRNFRNEGISTQHNPEFTMLEFYQAFSSYVDLMELTEELLSSLADEIHNTTVIKYGDKEIDFTPPYKRLNIKDAVVETIGLDSNRIKDMAYLTEVFKKRYQEEPPAGLNWGGILMEFFEREIEEKLVQPTFVVGFPIEVSPLARRSEDDPDFTDRFELIIGGMEVANGFSELNDPQDQYERFLDQLKKKEKGGEETHEMDKDYVEALEIGMYPAAGEGVGIDRLTMIMANQDSIRDVILFPLLRPES